MISGKPVLIDEERLGVLINQVLTRSHDLVTIREAAEMRGCSVQNLSQLVNHGRIRYMTVLGKRVLRREDVVTFNRTHPFNPRKATRPQKGAARRGLTDSARRA